MEKENNLIDMESAPAATGGDSSILQTLIDISHIITTSHGLEETLAHTVELIAQRMRVDVCSIYLADPQDNMLVLKATQGLNPQALDKVRIPPDQGLVGLVMQQGRPLNLLDVASHPRFMYFQGIDEERLSSFCGVPLIEYRKTLGVLTIQNQEHRLFSADEENLLITIASQISGLISKALLVDKMQEEAAKAKPRRGREPMRLEGVPIASGVAEGPVILLRRSRLEDPAQQPAGSPGQEKERLEQALSRSETEILELIRDVTGKLGEEEAAIFHAHLLFLEDRSFKKRIEALIDQGNSAAWSVHQVVQDYLKTFSQLDDPYLKERGADLEDVGSRLLHHLGLDRGADDMAGRSGILVAELLTPSDTARLDPAHIKGIVTTVGGFVSHAAILARSLRIPAVTGVERIADLAEEGETLVVDGEAGLVFINPSDDVKAEYVRLSKTREKFLSHLDELRDVEAATRDGHRVTLMANAGLSQDLADLERYGAEGIGLYRTEVQYLMATSRPTEAEMEANYAEVIKAARGKPVIFRTLDLGGDKFPPYMSFPKEENPFLGIRSIRYQLSRPQLFKEQLRALCRVALTGPVRILFPLISQLDELTQVLRLYQECRAEVEAELKRELPHIPLGMMFEVPSVVLMADLYAREVDFFSIGSNDLTQYTLAVDRNNPQVAHLYDPLDPAVLRLIRQLIQTARRYDKPLELCGEMASDTEGCLVLVGMGLRQLSMNAPLIPLVKDRLSKVSLSDMEKLANIAMNSTTAAAVRRNIQIFLKQF